MTKRIQGMFVAFAAVAAMALGGAVFASAQTSHTKATEPVAAVDKDNIQSGDQKTPDRTTKATELPGVESTTETTSETSSETAPSDGPGGHADAPGATVDHQFQGVE
ncbi:MAG: hypothetical protein M3Z06_12095 [Actinomycetota bacterium]|nr:hypothetical protein [Actinomycetota bacterium]